MNDARDLPRYPGWIPEHRVRLGYLRHFHRGTGGFALNRIPSTDDAANFAGHPAQMEMVRKTLFHGLDAVALAAIPLAVFVVLLSLSRGRSTQ